MATEQARATMDKIDKRLLNIIQMRFPLVPEPYQVIAAELGISEEELLERARRLKDEQIIRQISAIFDSRRLGYSSTLVAMDIPEEHIEESARIISEHPGVSHNYKRDHPFNLWFTLTLPPGTNVSAEAEALGEAAGARRVRVLPAINLFKIGVELDVETGVNAAREGVYDQTRPYAVRPKITDEDITYIRVLQQDLPLEPRPFLGWAESIGVSEEALLAKAAEFKERGIMRRFAAVLRHQRAGFTANGMICWRIPEDKLPELGLRLAAYPEVSHCYQRPVYPDWPYSVFSMVHALGREQCEDVARRMSDDIGIDDYAILYSTKEYKKERVQYFVPWDRKLAKLPTR